MSGGETEATRPSARGAEAPPQIPSGAGVQERPEPRSLAPLELADGTTSLETEAPSEVPQRPAPPRLLAEQAPVVSHLSPEHSWGLLGSAGGSQGLAEATAS